MRAVVLILYLPPCAHEAWRSHIAIDCSRRRTIYANRGPCRDAELTAYRHHNPPDRVQHVLGPTLAPALHLPSSGPAQKAGPESVVAAVLAMNCAVTIEGLRKLVAFMRITPCHKEHLVTGGDFVGMYRCSMVQHTPSACSGSSHPADVECSFHHEQPGNSLGCADRMWIVCRILQNHRSSQSNL